MTVRELIEILVDLPPDCNIYIDIDEFPIVTGAYHDEIEENGFPKINACLIEVTYPNGDDNK